MRDSRAWSLMFSGRIHPAGYFLIRWGIFMFFLSFLAAPIFLTICIFIVTCAIAFFFRDPDRIPTLVPGGIISPADGLITDIVWDVTPPEDLFPSLEKQDPVWSKISIFLNIYDVHVNRIPISGHIDSVVAKKGFFKSAISSHIGEENERVGILIRTSTGEKVACVQLAGFLARRILCSVNEGDPINAGDRYGIICFGSRVDIYLPKEAVVFVREGQRMVGGETLLGTISPQYIETE